MPTDKPKKLETEASNSSAVWVALAPALILLVQTVAISYFGFMLKDRLDLALKERQQNVQAVEVMAKLFDEYSGADDAKKEKIVARLAMFGPDAITPLLIFAVGKGENPRIPATGLKYVALRHFDEVCSVIAQALRDLPSSEELTNLKSDLKCR